MNNWLWMNCSLRGQKKQKGVARSAALHSDEHSKAKQKPWTLDPKTKSYRVSTFWCTARTSKIGLLILLLRMDSFARSRFQAYYSTHSFFKFNPGGVIVGQIRAGGGELSPLLTGIFFICPEPRAAGLPTVPQCRVREKRWGCPPGPLSSRFSLYSSLG